ncbi:MAG: YggT family protein [Deltaproteobacteria bacterium]|nr:YggT family protein [Deltaproteobacteria bacterium]
MINFIHTAATLITVLVIGRALLSWFPLDRNTPLVRLIHNLSEPLLAPVRNLLPQTGMVDLSALVVVLGVQVLEFVIIRILVSLS